MFSDDRIDRAANDLTEYRRTDRLSAILDQYAELIESYRRLKSDYEEEREGRERYKQLARGQERNPFALVVVDGDGYVFKDSFITARDEGGIRAAKQLNDAVKASLTQKGLGDCEVMIRIYANLAGLSKSLSKHSLCGPEKRSLATFAAGFNRSHGLADFIDAGELKENADHKLKAIVRLYADNAQCKHIYFAACHDVGYVADLTPYRGNSDRFTLVRTSGSNFHDQFTKLDMNVEEFSGVFRTTPLNYPSSAQPQVSTANPSSSTSSTNGDKICQYYSKGRCKYGDSCRNTHTEAKSPWSQTTFGRWGGSDAAIRTHRDPDSEGNPALLPKQDEIPDGYVALNKDQARLDAILTCPSTEAMRKLKAYTGQLKVCNRKQLNDSCDTEDCPYDHSPMPPDLKPALEWLSRSQPCSQKSACRRANCVSGHVCQKPDCGRRGGKAHCRIPHNLCLGDYRVSEIIPGTTSTGASPSVEWVYDLDEEAPIPSPFWPASPTG